jgi:hypothetical protein
MSTRLPLLSSGAFSDGTRPQHRVASRVSCTHALALTTKKDTFNREEGTVTQKTSAVQAGYYDH